ncbi:hypothetical protein CDAR_573541 [Caerostris darwini]|uniref:Uncharacterized protein n=1 Tax=Caerostris darwini TaxID=1538125 RepID=A0AAV4TC46_9ARAC|nr:hypothetical protein CDAR_573541 [Caerostris darwini]
MVWGKKKGKGKKAIPGCTRASFRLESNSGDESLITWRTRLYKALLAKTEFSGLIYLKGFSGNGKSESSVDRGPDSLLQLLPLS